MSRERTKLRPEINVTPLVDVVLVLLIICMVVTPQMEGPSVEMPTVRTPDPEDKKKMDTIIVVIEADGDTWLGQEAVPMDALEPRLVKLREESATKKVVVKADRETPFGKVREVYAMARRIGWPSVALKVGDVAESRALPEGG